MYTIFLTLRYLTRKKIVLFPILVVWLCVMMLIIVTSIMGGFVERVRTANRDLFGDIIISSASSSQGFAGYDELSRQLKAEFQDEVLATTPVVEAYSLLYVPFAQRSLPALLVGVKPDERAQVSQFREGLFQQYKAPMEALDDLAAKLPASNGKLLDTSYDELRDALSRQRSALRVRRRIEDGLEGPSIAYLRMIWLVVPAAAAVFLWIRAYRKRKVLAYVAPILVAIIGCTVVALAASWPVLFKRDYDLAVDRVQVADMAADRAERTCDAAEALVAKGLTSRMDAGSLPRETGQQMLRNFQGMVNIRRQLSLNAADLEDLAAQRADLTAALGKGVRPALGNDDDRRISSAELKSRQEQLAQASANLQSMLDQSRRVYDELHRDFNEQFKQFFETDYASRDALTKALVPAVPTFEPPLPPPPTTQGKATAPPEGCIVGSQIGFFRRDSRGNFIHPYPFFYPKVTITVFPPSKSGNIDVKGMNAVTQDFTIVDTAHSGVYDVDSTNVYAPFETVQIMAGMRQQPEMIAADPTTNFPPRCHQLLIKLKPAALPKMRLLRAQMKKFVSAFADKSEMLLPDALEVQTWDEKQARYLGAVQNEKTMMTFILLLMSGVVLVVIFLIFYQIVRDKTRDIGIIKAVGGSEIGVAAIFLSYGVMIGIVGGGLGVLTGTLFVTHTNEIHELIYQTTGIIIWDRSVYLFDRIPDVVNPVDCVVYFGVALIAGLLGAAIPALIAAFEDPVQAVRYE